MLSIFEHYFFRRRDLQEKSFRAECFSSLALLKSLEKQSSSCDFPPIQMGKELRRMDEINEF
jgi:hypothetical protein